MARKLGSCAANVVLAVCLSLLTRCTLACPKKAATMVTPSQSPAAYEGCYIDKRTPRDMPTLAGYNPDMKRDMCEEWCRKYRAKYFAMQEGISCWCGDDFGRHGKADELMCSVRCVGEREERCGGIMHNSVYKIVY